MQSEAGSAGALHGAASEGAIATTFTSSQGLLLMIPNIYKMCGELLPAVFEVAARTIATEALSIFGDHSDIYAVRSTGIGLVCSTSVQEALHMTAVAHIAAFASSIPFAHFLDGFRTTHEIQKIVVPTDEQLRACVDMDVIARFRARGLNPRHPVQRGTAQNPDVWFQANEAGASHVAAVPGHVENAFRTVNKVFGTSYSLFEYRGDPQATDVVVCMGSACETVAATIAALNNRGRHTGLLQVRLFRPFSAEHFARTLPATTERLCVLDRGRDATAAAEPLFEDVCTALQQTGRRLPLVIGGVYGLSSKDFIPDMVAAVFDNLVASSPVRRFVVGIEDDVRHTSLKVVQGVMPSADVLPAGTRECLLWGIGGDGTVGANKAAIKLIADETDLHAQGYFAYDANKSGGLTVSHLRFGPQRFEAPYSVQAAQYIACHNSTYVHRFDLLANLQPGGIFVLNCPWLTVAELDQHLPVRLRKQIAERNAQFYVIDATKIARETGIGPYINQILNTVFFALSGVVEVNRAIELVKQSIVKMYKRKGEDVV